MQHTPLRIRNLSTPAPVPFSLDFRFSARRILAGIRAGIRRLAAGEDFSGEKFCNHVFNSIYLHDYSEYE